MKQCSIIVTVLLFTMLAGIIIGSSHGCASGNYTSSTTQPVLQPVAVARDAHTVYDLIVSGLTTLKQTGVISDQQKNEIEPIRKQVYSALVEMDKAALQKNTNDFYSAKTAFDLALPSLRDWLIKEQKKSTTQPVRTS